MIFIVFFTGSVQNTTIEEWVALLEIQVMEIEEDITGLNIGLVEVDENVDFLFDEQVIQDESLLDLEQTSDQVVVELAVISVDLLGERYT